MFLLDPVDAQHATSARAHCDKRLVVREQDAGLDAHPRAAHACKVTKERGLGFVDLAHADGHRKLHGTHRRQQLAQPAGKLSGVQLDRPLDAPAGVAPVHILAETAQVDGLAANFGALGIEVTRQDRVMRERQAVDDARLAGTIGAVDQGNRAQRDLLGLSESFEIP